MSRMPLNDKEINSSYRKDKELDDAEALLKDLNKYYNVQLGQRDNIIKMLENTVKELEKRKQDNQ